MRKNYLWRFQGDEPKQIHDFLDAQKNIGRALRILTMHCVDRYGTVDITSHDMVERLRRDNELLKELKKDSTIEHTDTKAKQESPKEDGDSNDLNYDDIDIKNL